MSYPVESATGVPRPRNTSRHGVFELAAEIDVQEGRVDSVSCSINSFACFHGIYGSDHGRAGICQLLGEQVFVLHYKNAATENWTLSPFSDFVLVL